MKVSELCKTFNTSHQTVYEKIKNNADVLEGHITKEPHKSMELDSFAVNFLKPKKATYKALDDRNYYLYKKNKEIAAENEQLKAERDKLASKSADSDTIIEFMGKQVKEYADTNARLKIVIEELQNKCCEANDLKTAAEKGREIDIQRYEAEKTELTDRIAELTEKVNNQTAVIDRLTEEKSTAESEKDEYRKAAETAESRVAELESELSDKVNEIEQLSTKKSFFTRKK